MAFPLRSLAASEGRRSFVILQPFAGRNFWGRWFRVAATSQSFSFEFRQLALGCSPWTATPPECGADPRRVWRANLRAARSPLCGNSHRGEQIFEVSPKGPENREFEGLAGGLGSAPRPGKAPLRAGRPWLRVREVNRVGAIHALRDKVPRHGVPPNMVSGGLASLEVSIKSAVPRKADLNGSSLPGSLEPKILHLDGRSRQNHRSRQTRAPSVRFNPLGKPSYQSFIPESSA
jgi:hypothetical protein